MDEAPSATGYRLLVQHSPVMIWRSGLDALCDYFNETWLAFTGRAPFAMEYRLRRHDGESRDDSDRMVAAYS